MQLVKLVLKVVNFAGQRRWIIDGQCPCGQPGKWWTLRKTWNNTLVAAKAISCYSLPVS
jgi:hypothetical protein